MSDVIESKKLPNSGMAIAGLVLGIIALVSSWIPIVNNLSVFVGLIGAVLAILGLVGVLRGKKGGKGLAIAAVIVNVIAIAVVLATQSAYSDALDKATSAPSATEVSSSDSAESDTEEGSDSKDSQSDEGEDSVDASALNVGMSVKLSNGLTVSVDSIATGLTNYDGTTVTGVQVTIANGSSDNVDFGSYDWKCEDANGVQTDVTYYESAENELETGTLSAGGTVTGMLYFDGEISKVHYYGNMFDSNPSATWILS